MKSSNNEENIEKVDSTVEKDKSMSRRDVIRSGGTVLAGLAALGLTGSSTAQAQQPNRNNNGNGEPLRGQVAVVTGAGRGIGRASAIALAQAGADVVVLNIGRDIAGHSVPLSKSADMAETVRLVQNEGRKAIAVQADIRDMDALQKAADRTIREFGKIDILFANAGILGQGTVEKTSEEQWRLCMDVNLIGTVNSMRAVLPHMLSRKTGRIIVTASTFGRQGTGTNVPYAAAKWGLIGIVKSTALEVGKSNITVNAVAPTGVVTGFGGPRTNEQRAQADEFFRTSYHALDVGALQPEDVAGTVVFLASPAARYVSGAVIDVAAGANARYTA